MPSPRSRTDPHNALGEASKRNNERGEGAGLLVALIDDEHSSKA